MGLSPSSKAALLTSTGQFLAQTGKSNSVRKRLGDTGDEMEKSLLKEIRQKGFGTVFGRGHPPDVVAGFYKIPFINWYLVLFADGREILEPMVRFRFYYILAGIAALVTILLLIRFTTRYVGRSISAITAAAARVREGDYSIKLPRQGSDEIGQLTRRFNEMIQGLKQMELIEETFGRYVDKKVAEELMRRPEALNMGGKKKVVTMMMTDLRNFTAAAEKLQPEEVIRLLNRHFAQNIEVIERYKGIIVDFYGDSILVFFDGVDSDPAARAADAVRCAIEMQSRHEAFVEQMRAEGLPEMGMGIGIHTGEVVIGNIGAETRAKYGIVGSDVNLTDRIQATAGPGKIVISKETYQVLADRITVSGEFTVCLKGIEQDRELYEVECLDSVCLLPPTQ
jgi:class 3 adenylate cyclase